MSKFLEKIFKKYHTYPAIFILFFLGLGFAIAWQLKAYAAMWMLPFAILSILSTGIAFIFHSKKIFEPLIFFSVIFLSIAMMWQRILWVEENHISFIESNDVNIVYGKIIDIHIRGEGLEEAVLKVDSLNYRGDTQQASGSICLIETKPVFRFEYGQIIQLANPFIKPDLPQNPGAFNYRKFQNLNGVTWLSFVNERTTIKLSGTKGGNFIFREIVAPVKNYIILQIESYFTGDLQSLLLAMIPGEKKRLGKELKKSFSDIGIIHILAISGLHVSYILFIFLTLFTLLRIPYNYKIIATLLILFFFSAIVNFSAPVIRAALMAFVFYLARLKEIPAKPINSVGFVALVLLAVNPLYLIDAGFQFSFSAVFGILYGYPAIQSFFPTITRRSKIKYAVHKTIFQPFLVSFSAVLATLPLTWYYFGSIQTGALISNLIVIPLVGLILMLSFIFLFFTLIPGFPELGLSNLIEFWAEILFDLVHLFNQLPLMKVELQSPGILLTLSIFGLIYLIFNLNKRKYRLIFGMYLLSFIFLYYWENSVSDRLLKVYFASVGQGDGAVLQFPSEDVAVIDAGNFKKRLDSGKRHISPILKHLNIKRIKYLIVSHSHSDHYGGFFHIINHYEVDTLIISKYENPDKQYRSLLSLAKNKNIPISFKERGAQLNVGENARCYVLHPYGRYQSYQSASGKHTNNSSLVLKVVLGETSVLFTGDLEKDAELGLYGYADFLKSNILKVGHHGSKTSTSPTFLNYISPEYAIISVGKKNRYKHPSKLIMSRLLNHNIKTFRTDHSGALAFELDGKNIKRIYWRK
jgi:competence protein ComEC